ncbi:MAG: DUF3160 domain-containing protein [Ignavibacteria bacterium]|nr:DUF3160 domain-containing protein [Ignavibacteria bacterium]
MNVLTIAFTLLVLVAGAAAQPSSVYESNQFRNRYGERVLPPPIDLAQDIDAKSLEDLRFLRNTVYARKGHLFKDAALRAVFQAFDWYQPIWWEKDFAVTLDAQEQAFVARLKTREDALLARNFTGDGIARKADVRNLVNTRQFAGISDTLRTKLGEHGFAIVPERQLQLFDIYEENDYNLVPSFVTTDLYLQLMHMYFDFTLRTLEEKRLASSLAELLAALHARATALAASAPGPEAKRAAEFVAAYCAVPLALLSGKSAPPPPKPYAQAVALELRKIAAAADRGSAMLASPLFDYSQFRPRGHYTRNKALAKYFRAMMWLQLAPLALGDADGAARAAVLSSITATAQAKGGRSVLDLYTAMSEPLRFLVGEPDNLSVLDGIAEWKVAASSAPPGQEFSAGVLASFRDALVKRNPERIPPRGDDALTQQELSKPKLFFFPQRYTPDAEILQRLVHVLRDPSPRRPIPKGLDVFAAFGNAAAESVLLDEYREAAAWPAYPDSLRAVRRDFLGPSDTTTVYGKWLGSLRAIERVPGGSQPFMRTDAWQRKCLNTALASWTELKHDVVLYAKQPMAAECGGDEPPPPPVTVGYVEPAVDFWKDAVAMLRATRRFLVDARLMVPEINAKTNSLIEMGEFLLRVSEKELRGERLADKEYETIRLIGSSAGAITLSIIDAPDWYSVTGPDRSIAIATDVYTYNDRCLQNAVGFAHSIYVVVEIDGLLTLTRGAVFSYHEFTHPAAERLTDEAWQKMLEDGTAPGPPIWMRGILAPITPLEMAPGSSYSSGC